MKTSPLFWRVSKWLFCTVIALFVLKVATHVVLPESELSADGCYWVDDLIRVIECANFPGESIFAFLLNLPTEVLFWRPFISIYGVVLWTLSGVGAPQLRDMFYLIYGFFDVVAIFVGLLYPFRLAYLKWFSAIRGG